MPADRRTRAMKQFRSTYPDPESSTEADDGVVRCLLAVSYEADYRDRLSEVASKQGLDWREMDVPRRRLLYIVGQVLTFLDILGPDDRLAMLEFLIEMRERVDLDEQMARWFGNLIRLEAERAGLTL